MMAELKKMTKLGNCELGIFFCKKNLSFFRFMIVCEFIEAAKSKGFTNFS